MITFEENYIFRNNRSITSNEGIALTESVANAWDAGAHNVFITIPNKENGQIIIEDDGTGMSDDEFKSRWMTLNYDRQKRQGKWAVFPDGDKTKRIAYGRNGVGRHGMLCFANSYKVETWKDGIKNTFEIAVSNGEAPFEITSQKSVPQNGHGTRISAFVERHLPNIEQMTDVLSARFLYDPNFTVMINSQKIELSEHKGLELNKEIQITNSTKAKLMIVDSTQTASKSLQHGVAFWVAGRLVGKPSWSYGGTTFLDGRLKPAKRYTVIVQSDDLINEVLPDWTGFIESHFMSSVYSAVKNEVDEFMKSIMVEQIRELRQEVINDSLDDLEELSLTGKRDISVFLENVTEQNPIISQEFLKAAVDALIITEKTKNGASLLSQLSQLSAEKIDTLSELLTTWDINDIASVLNEIDKRILVIEAIEKLYRDPKTDELHVLHPLVLNARWLFGAEFDSPMFVSNSALSTVIKTLFKDDDYDLSMITNPRKRPDIVCLKTSSLSAVCTERMDQDSKLIKPDQILIVELKRGGFPINYDEVTQAENYVRQIRKSGCLHKAAEIDAFVVGGEIGDIDTEKTVSSGRIHIVTYGHLVDTASQKLFRLREQLKNHYDSLGKESIVEKALGKGYQEKIKV